MAALIILYGVTDVAWLEGRTSLSPTFAVVATGHQNIESRYSYTQASLYSAPFIGAGINEHVDQAIGDMAQYFV